MSFNKQQAINILTYWHQTEFFNCIDLKDLSNDRDGVIHYGAEALLEDANCLPWLNRSNIRRAGKGFYPSAQYSFSLYIGIFKNSEFFDQATKYFGEEENELWEERKSDGGLTCSAKVQVNKDGILLLDTLELSTAPWALGQVLQGNIDNIRFDDFEKNSKELVDKLNSLNKLASNLKQSFGLSDALTTFEIVEILKILGDWASFIPGEKAPAIIVKPNRLARDSSKPNNSLVPESAKLKLQQLSNKLTIYDENNETLSEAEEETPLENDIEDDDQISILNSFYLRDIERVRDLIRSDKIDKDSPVITFLSNNAVRNPDLLSSDGEKIIGETVSLDKTPFGRWPSDSEHSMSLMQQFAINTIDRQLYEQGLYSVNGPPGTGKTTMLRDLVANNVVNRARILSTLDHSHAAFCGEVNVKVGDEIKRGVKRLIPELTGFEMVVVSNNNSAVENISKELPQTKAVGDEFESLDYLKSVAQKLAAKHDDENYVYSLNDDEDCWGLVAAALGNYDNRKSFGNKVQFSKIESLNHKDEESKRYSTLVPAIKGLIKSCSNVEEEFQKAQKDFSRSENLVKRCISEVSQLESIAQLEKNRALMALKVDRHKDLLSMTEYALAKIKSKNVSVFRIKKWCLNGALKKAFEGRLTHRKLGVERLEAKLKKMDISIQEKRDNCRALYERHSDIVFKCQVDDFESKDIQRTTFGHSKALNKARSELTIKAFNLHQAWLAACYEKCFSINVNNFCALINGDIKEYEHAKILWQSLFMVIPVVSSAFASVANQFSRMRQGDIGWLFIDEAGQATPQLAVGAMLRSKRVVVVGDPLQVEPVFTTPPEFVEYFGKKLLGNSWDRWAPTVASVQTVSDAVNPFGTGEISESLWLGSPLRVHRRCADPMFTIANEIAYNHKMIHGNDEFGGDKDSAWGESCWFDISGDVKGKHYVPEQGEFVLERIYSYLTHTGVLPDCCIISPFKDVVSQIASYLKWNFDHPLCGKEKFKTWLKGRVGTVHTFQGKEEEMVLFVLGASVDASGGSIWAARKPNLLNVAVTRAKKQVFLVGCKKVWGKLSHFDTANAQLPTIKVAETAETV